MLRIIFVIIYLSNFKLMLYSLLSFRSLFIWRPKDNSDTGQQKDERKTIVLGGKPDKKPNKKFGGDSDDSDDELFSAKGKMSKAKPALRKKAKTR